MPEKLSQQEKDDVLLLEHQLCFPLYACAREVIKRYRPFLEGIGLTYTQYITMMVLWEQQSVSSRELGRRLFLDSGTLTPVLKKLETMGYISRSRDEKDERNLIVSITEAGRVLKASAAEIPVKMAECIRFDPQDAARLYVLLHRLLDTMNDTGE
jgi:DNA-binding MarR family transcriptional regulator